MAVYLRDSPWLLLTDNLNLQHLYLLNFKFNNTNFQK